MTTIDKIPPSHNQPPVEPELLESRRTRRLTIGIGLAAVVLGGFVFDKIPFGNSSISKERPDFIIEGDVGSAHIRGAVTLRCIEHKDSFAVVHEKIRLITTRTDVTTHLPGLPKGRVLAADIDAASNSCNEVLATIKRNPSKELGWALGDIDTFKDWHDHDGDTERAEKYAYAIERYDPQPPVLPVYYKK